VFSSTQFKWMMLCHDGAKQIAHIDSRFFGVTRVTVCSHPKI